MISQKSTIKIKTSNIPFELVVRFQTQFTFESLIHFVFIFTFGNQTKIYIFLFLISLEEQLYYYLFLMFFFFLLKKV